MSNLATLARPYAKAAFGLADSLGALPEWDSLLQAAAVIVSDESMVSLLGNPMADRKRVVSIITDALGEAAEGKFSGFITVLGDNDRLPLLPEISRLFGELRQAAEQRLNVRVVSAIELDEDQASRMKAALARRFDREIEMVSEIDASILGGAVIYAGDQVIDGSLRGRLEQLKANLVS